MRLLREIASNLRAVGHAFIGEVVRTPSATSHVHAQLERIATECGGRVGRREGPRTLRRAA